MKLIKITDESRLRWKSFISNNINQGHAERFLYDNDVDKHVKICWESALRTARQVKLDVGNLAPINILEVGSSTGLNCFALQKIYPNSTVYGVEPEKEAVLAAKSMKMAIMPIFKNGVGENLPIESDSIDLIVCHTVIEHVSNVGQVIEEFNRVLKVGGYLHINSPNYIWPYEPHLGVWCLPLLGKRLVKICAFLQGKSRKIHFIDHLKFVTPNELEKQFKIHNLAFKNRALNKINQVLSGDLRFIVAHKNMAYLLRFMGYLKLGKIVASVLIFLGLYPSLMYTVKKTSNA